AAPAGGGAPAAPAAPAAAADTLDPAAAAEAGKVAGTAIDSAKTFAQTLVSGATSMFGFTAPPQTQSVVTTVPGGGQVPGVADMTGQQMIETVVARGMSVVGVQYAWGGGSPYGATRGIHDGGVADEYGDYNKLGFDCSGLMMYMFGAVGINLPHYTGYQYNVGEHVPLSQMKRGDMIFYGPDASEHVAMYLGNDEMIEAPESGSAVKISPLRTAGAMPYAVRLINS
ncbi:NlpC/P60 family protein, partial [Tsukamurella soli]